MSNEINKYYITVTLYALQSRRNCCGRGFHIS